MRRHGYSVALWKKDMSGYNLLARGDRRESVTQDADGWHSVGTLLPGAPAPQKPFFKINNILLKKQYHF